MCKVSSFHLVGALWTISWFWSFCRSIDFSYICTTIFDLVKDFFKLQTFKVFSLSNDMSSVYFYMLISKKLASYYPKHFHSVSYFKKSEILHNWEYNFFKNYIYCLYFPEVCTDSGLPVEVIQKILGDCYILTLHQIKMSPV